MRVQKEGDEIEKRGPWRERESKKEDLWKDRRRRRRRRRKKKKRGKESAAITVKNNLLLLPL